MVTIIKPGTRILISGPDKNDKIKAIIDEVLIGIVQTTYKCKYWVDSNVRYMDLLEGEFEVLPEQDNTEKQIGFKVIKGYEGAKIIMSSTPTGQGDYYRKLWEEAMPKLSNTDSVLSMIKDMSLKAEDLLNTSKALTEAMSNKTWPSNNVIWQETPKDKPWHDPTVITKYGDDNDPRYDPLTAWKLNAYGSELVDQTAVGNPDGWYYKDSNNALVFHLPKRERPANYNCPDYDKCNCNKQDGECKNLNEDDDNKEE